MNAILIRIDKIRLRKAEESGDKSSLAASAMSQKIIVWIPDSLAQLHKTALTNLRMSRKPMKIN